MRCARVYFRSPRCDWGVFARGASADAIEADLIGAKPSEVEILPSHLSQLSPIDDVRGSGGYRLDIVQEQCRRAIQKAAENG